MGKQVSKSAFAFLLASGLILSSGTGALAGGPVSISGGQDYAHVVVSDGTVLSFGSGVNNKLGFTYSSSSGSALTTPLQVKDLTDFATVDAGYNHSVALAADKTVWTWGLNNYGQAGLSTTIAATQQPMQMTGLSNIVDIASGEDHSLALDAGGTLYGWGANYNGQLGNGNATNTSTPVTPLLSGIKDASAGKRYTVVVRTDGNVWAWGNNTYMQGGRVGYNSTRPNQVMGISGVKTVEAGGTHVVALKADGTVWFWGTDVPGATEFTQSATPLQIQGISGATAIAAGNGHSLILKSDGTVWAFGSNSNGQLGNPTAAYTGLTAVQVADLTNVTKISAGGNTSYALKADGTLWTWGANSLGQFGNGTTTPSQVPVKNQNIVSTVDVSAVPYYRQITLNYSAPQLQVAKYKIRENYYNAPTIYEGTATTWVHSNLSNDRTYNYVVEAYDATGNLIAKSTTSAKTLNGNLTFKGTADGYDKVTFNWGMAVPNPALAYYSIQESISRSGFIQEYNLTENTISFSNLKPGEPYNIRVIAYDAAGYELGRTWGETVRTKEEIVPYSTETTVSSYTLTLGQGNFTPSKYVFKDQSNKVLYEGLNNSYTLTNQMPGRNAAISYDIYNELGQWVTNETVYAQMQAATFDYSVSEVTSNSLKLNFASTNYDGVAKVEVRRNNVVIYTGLGTSYTDNGLLPNTSYTYKVTSYDAKGWSIGTWSPTVTTAALPAPTEPAPETAPEAAPAAPATPAAE